MCWQICNCCGRHLALWEFNRSKYARFGVDYKCKVCTRAYVKYVSECKKLKKETEGKCGRPKGWVMPDSVKAKIAKSKTGYKHDRKTKSKIAESLVKYFKNNPASNTKVSTEMLRRMKGNLIARSWIRENREGLDDNKHLFTDKYLENRQNIEIPFGEYIELLFSHNMNPEVIYLAKEYCEENGLDFEEFMLDTMNNEED